jgi:hypothetical protein
MVMLEDDGHASELCCFAQKITEILEEHHLFWVIAESSGQCPLATDIECLRFWRHGCGCGCRGHGLIGLTAQRESRAHF